MTKRSHIGCLGPSVLLQLLSLIIALIFKMFLREMNIFRFYGSFAERQDKRFAIYLRLASHEHPSSWVLYSRSNNKNMIRWRWWSPFASAYDKQNFRLLLLLSFSTLVNHSTPLCYYSLSLFHARVDKVASAQESQRNKKQYTYYLWVVYIGRKFVSLLHTYSVEDF
jgi:hypothetical protein